TDDCGNTATCVQHFTWTVATEPVFDDCVSTTTDLGCNPDPDDIPNCDNTTTPTAHNECGPVPVTCDSVTTSSGCSRQRTVTYTATGCDLSSTGVHIFTWTVATVPVFDNCTSDEEPTDLGCN